MTNHSRAQHVGDELVLFPVPDEQCGTRTSATVELSEFLRLVGSDFNFILQHASGPEHTDHVGLLRLAKSHGQIRRVLPEISVGAVDFVFLANAVGENFDLGPDSGFVAVQALEREPQPVVLVAAFVLEQDGGAVVLGDKQVGGTVVVVVSGDDGARLFELNFVEADVGGDVSPAVGAKVAE